MRKSVLFLFVIFGIFMAACEQKTPAKEKIMTDYTINKNIHHYLGIELNIQVWNLLAKEERKPEEDSKMIAMAFGSQYHWYKSPNWQPVNAQRGEWIISHVFAVLGKGKEALNHAESCMKMTEEQNLTGFDLAYAYEAMARAHAANQNIDQSKEFYQKATLAGNEITGEDRKLFLADLTSEPWFGLKL